MAASEPIIDLEERKTLTVDEAARIVGCSRRVAYDAVRKGQIPSLRIGDRRIVVPVAALLRLLGEEPD